MAFDASGDLLNSDRMFKFLTVSAALAASVAFAAPAAAQGEVRAAFTVSAIVSPSCAVDTMSAIAQTRVHVQCPKASVARVRVGLDSGSRTNSRGVAVPLSESALHAQALTHVQLSPASIVQIDF
jgi:hypothetical protein